MIDHEDLVHELLEIPDAQAKATLRAKAEHMCGNFDRAKKYEGRAVQAQEKLFAFLDRVTITDNEAKQ